MNIAIKSQEGATPGWATALRRMGYTVLTRPGSFACEHIVVKKGKDHAVFTSAKNGPRYADIGDVIVANDLRSAGIAI